MTKGYYARVGHRLTVSWEVGVSVRDAVLCHEVELQMDMLGIIRIFCPVLMMLNHMVYFKVIIGKQDPTGSGLFVFIQEQDSRLQVAMLL